MAKSGMLSDLRKASSGYAEHPIEIPYASRTTSGGQITTSCHRRFPSMRAMRIDTIPTNASGAAYETEIGIPYGMVATEPVTNAKAIHGAHSIEDAP